MHHPEGAVMNTPAKSRPLIRAVRAKLMDLQGKWLLDLTVVVGEEVPKIVMFNGDPFLLEPYADEEFLLYFQERPFRADVGA